jgi:hypothetical protein
MPALNAAQIVAVASQYTLLDAACACGALKCAGWESLSATFDASLLRLVGCTNDRDPYDEPTLEEHHPQGTRYDAADAPIAIGHFPYNRCEIWQCVHCTRPFLRYTEYGGYYVDQRIRELNAALLIDTIATQGR